MHSSAPMLDQAQREKVFNRRRYILAVHSMANNRSKCVTHFACTKTDRICQRFICLILSSSPSLSTNRHQTKRVPFSSQPHKIAIAFVLVRTTELLSKANVSLCENQRLLGKAFPRAKRFARSTEKSPLPRRLCSQRFLAKQITVELQHTPNVSCRSDLVDR